MEMCAGSGDQMLKYQRIKLGFTAFARTFVLARKETPAANVSLEGDSIVHRDYVGLGVSVAITQGPRHVCAERWGCWTDCGPRQEGVPW
jgi:hypothetical protein